MYILTQDGKQLINMDGFSRISIVDENDCQRFVLSNSADDKPITIARYARSEDAKNILVGIMHEIVTDYDGYFIMPESILNHAESKKKDARTKRKGGS